MGIKFNFFLKFHTLQHQVWHFSSFFCASVSIQFSLYRMPKISHCRPSSWMCRDSFLHIIKSHQKYNVFVCVCHLLLMLQFHFQHPQFPQKAWNICPTFSSSPCRFFAYPRYYCSSICEKWKHLRLRFQIHNFCIYWRRRLYVSTSLYGCWYRFVVVVVAGMRNMLSIDATFSCAHSLPSSPLFFLITMAKLQTFCFLRFQFSHT